MEVKLVWGKKLEMRDRMSFEAWHKNRSGRAGVPGVFLVNLWHLSSCQCYRRSGLLGPSEDEPQRPSAGLLPASGRERVGWQPEDSLQGLRTIWKISLP